MSRQSLILLVLGFIAMLKGVISLLRYNRDKERMLYAKKNGITWIVAGLILTCLFIFTRLIES